MPTFFFSQYFFPSSRLEITPMCYRYILPEHQPPYIRDALQQPLAYTRFSRDIPPTEITNIEMFAVPAADKGLVYAKYRGKWHYVLDTGSLTLIDVFYTNAYTKTRKILTEAGTLAKNSYLTGTDVIFLLSAPGSFPPRDEDGDEAYEAWLSMRRQQIATEVLHILEMLVLDGIDALPSVIHYPRATPAQIAILLAMGYQLKSPNLYQLSK